MASDPSGGASGSGAPHRLQKRRHQETAAVTSSLKSSAQPRFNLDFSKWMQAVLGQIFRDFWGGEGGGCGDFRQVFPDSAFCLQPAGYSQRL